MATHNFNSNSRRSSALTSPQIRTQPPIGFTRHETLLHRETTLCLSDWRLSAWHSIPRRAKRETPQTLRDEEERRNDRRKTENLRCSSINWWCWVPYARPYGAEPLRRAVIDSLQPLTQPGTFTNKRQTINICPERERGGGGGRGREGEREGCQSSTPPSPSDPDYLFVHSLFVFLYLSVCALIKIHLLTLNIM